MVEILCERVEKHEKRYKKGLWGTRLVPFIGFKGLSLYCDVDCFSFGALSEAAFEQVHVASAVEHLARFAVIAQKDAALGVARGVAGVDANALPFLIEVGTSQQQRQPLFELRRP